MPSVRDSHLLSSRCPDEGLVQACLHPVRSRWPRIGQEGTLCRRACLAGRAGLAEVGRTRAQPGGQQTSRAARRVAKSSAQHIHRETADDRAFPVGSSGHGVAASPAGEARGSRPEWGEGGACVAPSRYYGSSRSGGTHLCEERARAGPVLPPQQRERARSRSGGERTPAARRPARAKPQRCNVAFRRLLGQKQRPEARLRSR